MREAVTPTAPIGDAERFYEARYAGGYMETWPDWKRERVRALVADLPLPAAGAALDFGCGNGVFTQVLLDALPGWKVAGTEISATALANARARVQGATFFRTGDPASGRRFDLVFTHHVLEHVLDLGAALDRIDGYLNERAAVLHILPCGNPGSFEHEVCRLRADGIDPGREGRYFFEDEGHVRRLDTARLAGLYAGRGFRLERAFYGGQEAGAVNWITASGTRFVRDFTDPARAVDAAAARRLRALRRRLGRLAYLRWVKREVEGRRARGQLTPMAYVRLAACWPLYVAGCAVDRRLLAASAREWDERRNEPNGSEMYLLFRREGAG
jgi:SAM-dependent methyltransferase